MGLIIKNGIKYFGDNSVELTQAQYDALSQAEKLNGTTYYIIDGQNITTASAVSYNNTASGLTATDVQGAIDEVDEKTGVELTQAQYDALEQAGTLESDVTYYIKDVNNPNVATASQVMYDNSDSGLSATNVQDAINEVSEEIDELQTAIFKISAELTGSTVSINANSWGDSIVDIPLITGYRPIAFYKVYPNSPTNLCINSFDIEYTDTSKFGRVRLRNLSSSTISAYAIVSILYLRA